MEKLLEAIQTNDGNRPKRGRGLGRGSRRGGASRKAAVSAPNGGGVDADALPVAFMMSKPGATNELTSGDIGAGGDTTDAVHTQEQENGEADLYTWCEECGMNNIGDCFIHGKVIAVTDNKLPSRARLSLPSILTLKKVKSENQEQQGVFAKRLIKPRTQFGPLEAPVLALGEDLPPGVFDVRVMSHSQQDCLDLSREEACNWMMFVRPAQTSLEVNLAAYQLNNQIYYISTKAIHQMSELRVWYLTSYGRQFGKEPLPLSLQMKPVVPAPGEVNDGVVEPEPEIYGTRSSAGLSPEKLVCGLCNIPFRSLPQLAAHTCRALEEPEQSGGSPRPARRKGQPRKVNNSSPRKGRSRSASVAQSPAGKLPLQIDLDEPVSSSTQEPPPVPKKRGRPKGSRTRSRDDEDYEKSLCTGKDDAKKRKKPRLDCQYCERSFYSEEQHRVHEAEHTGSKPYVCEYPGCGKGFGSKFKHWRHSLVHDQPQNRQCPYCPRSFNRVDHLKNHVMTHDSNRKLWACEKCGKQYLYRSTYMFHIAQHSAQEGNHLSCDICSQSFQTKEALVQHVKTHNRYKPDLSKEKVHKCPDCQKLFTTSKDVRRHMVTHTKDRSFLCEFCPQTFARKDHLRRHYKSNHKKEVLEAAAASSVDFPCIVCLQVFKCDQHLQYHMDSAHPAGSVPVSVKKEKGVKQVLQQEQLPQTIMQLKDPDGTIVLVSAPKLHVSQAESLRTAQVADPMGLLSPAGQPPMPIQIHINQHHQHSLRQEHQLQQPHSLTIQPASLFTTRNVEVVSEAGEPFTQQSMSLKTIPCRFSQLLAPVNPTPPPTSIISTSHPNNLRQILSSYPHQHQQQQQHQATQQQVVQQQQHSVSLSQQLAFSQSDIAHTTTTPTIVSMLSMPRQDGAMDSKQAHHMQDANTQLKNLSTPWVPETSLAQPVTDGGDHCYATGTASSTGDTGLKLPSLALPNKVVGPVTQISDLETLRLFQSCYSTSGLGMGSGQGILSQSSNTSGSTSLQAQWDIADLVAIPLSDMMPTISTTQPSIINLPVTLSVNKNPTTEGYVATTDSLSLTQHA